MAKRRRMESNSSIPLKWEGPKVLELILSHIFLFLCYVFVQLFGMDVSPVFTYPYFVYSFHLLVLFYLSHPCELSSRLCSLLLLRAIAMRVIMI